MSQIGTPNALLQRTESSFLPLLVECLTYGRMRQYFLPHSVETERQKGLSTERQNGRIQKDKSRHCQSLFKVVIRTASQSKEEQSVN